MARPMPREAPVTSATLSVQSVAHGRRLLPAPRWRRGSPIAACTSIVRRDSLDQAGEHPARADLDARGARRAARWPAPTLPSAPARSPAGPGAPRCAPASSFGVGLDVRDDRHRAAARSRRAPARRARRSAAGCISAQWKGALTVSGFGALGARAPSAPAHARSTAAVCPAITICPAPFKFAGSTTSPAPRTSRASGARRRRRRAPGSRPWRPARRHGLLHELPAQVHQPHRVREATARPPRPARSTRRASGRPRRRDAARCARAAREAPRRWSSGSPAGCWRSA